jgi:lipopolysaccharide assembly outer membrane protein LptD (OstA)
MPESVFPSVPDSLTLNKTELDSLFYTADSIYFQYDTELIKLYGQPQINYQDAEIIADSLIVDLKKERAYSYGPTRMRDGDQLLLGSNVRYDVATQTGMLDNGYSMMEKGYYGGSELRKWNNNVYDIDNGTFTNCDLEEPSFWFKAKQLRIYRSDKIVGKPVIAYVNHFPVFYFPFISIPIRRGRYPGFLIPEPGYNSVDGKYLRDIAWYYPYKDYADLTIGFDLMEKTGWNAKLNTQYIKRYAYTGNLNASFQHGIYSYGRNDDWSVQGRHHHDLPEKSSLDANINYISNKRIWEGSDDIDQSLAQRLTSSISYAKPMGSSYLNAGSYFTQDLVNDTASLSLPSASFSLSSRPVSELFSLPSDSWLSNLSYRYSTYLEHTGYIREKNYSFSDLIWNNATDPADSTGMIMLNEHHLGMKHLLGASYYYKLFGWLNMGQSFDFSEAWMDRDKKDKKPARGNDYSASMHASFNLYGIRNFQNFPITSMRHIASPSVSLTYQPDNRRNADLYNFGSIGVRSSDKAANMNFSIDNKWQLKYGKAANEKRLNEFLTWRSSVSAGLYKKHHPLSIISHTFALKPEGISLGDLKINHSRYKLGAIKLAYASQISFVQNPYEVQFNSMSLKSQYFAQSIAISGSAPYEKYYTAPKNLRFDSFGSSDTINVVMDMVRENASDNNWSISLTHDLYASKDIFQAESNNLRMSFSGKITSNWSIIYSNYYNLKTKDMISQGFSISRDLHCWKMDIAITHRNEYWDYRIVLFNKLLPDALRFQTRDSKKY